MASSPLRAVRIAALAVLLALPAHHAGAASAPMPAEFQGDWVPASGACDAAVRLRVDSDRMTLANGKDTQSWGDLETALSFFGPDYQGTSVVVMPDFGSGNPPFTVYFNADDKQGVTKVEIYVEIKGNTNPQVAALQATAKKLAQRFPLNMMPLKKCPRSGG